MEDSYFSGGASGGRGWFVRRVWIVKGSALYFLNELKVGLEFSCPQGRDEENKMEAPGRLV